MQGVRDRLLFTGASLYLGQGRWATGSLLVRDGRIAAIGRDGSIEDAEARRIDLAGRSLLPGFQDAHVHPMVAGEALLGIDLSPVHSLEGYRAAIAAGAAATSAPVLTGNGWYGDLFPGGFPDAAFLDGIVPGRPLILTGHDGHSCWLNSAALAAAGIDRGTPDPPDGAIVRDAAGNPTGVLLDGAMSLARPMMPPLDEARQRAALLAAQDRLLRAGITGWQDAMVGDSELGPDPQAAYARLAEEGLLRGHVVQGLWWDRTQGLEQIEDLVARREAARGVPGVSADVVKIMQDGMVENRTAALLAPYADQRDGGSGPSFIDPALLAAATVELERHGFDVHFHAVGDRAVRECLDAVSAARAANGRTALRHQIAHLDLVDPADLPRFAALDVTANVQMLWARRDKEIVERKLAQLGPERAAHHFPFGDLHRAGARLAAGSDWPVSAPDPLLAVHTAVNRTAPRQDVHAVGDGVLDVPLEPRQALDLGAALDAFLTGAAWVNRRETRSGALRVGLDADLVVLDADLRTAPEIGAVRVSQTLIGGRSVTSAPSV